MITSAQYDILSFLKVVGRVSIVSLNRNVVSALKKKGYVTVEVDKVSITQKGIKDLKKEIECGKKLLYKNKKA